MKMMNWRHNVEDTITLIHIPTIKVEGNSIVISQNVKRIFPKIPRWRPKLISFRLDLNFMNLKLQSKQKLVKNETKTCREVITVWNNLA